MPDLYRGEPLVVVAKLGATGPEVRVSGQRAGHSFAEHLPLDAPAASARSAPDARRAPGTELGIHRLWARRKIEALMDRVILDGNEEQLRPEVTALALRHGVLSQYTSLIAVDSARTVAGPGRDAAVPNALPAGNAMFGNMPQTATPAPLYLLLGALSLAGAWGLRLRRPRTADARTASARARQ